jgi:conjugative relaxase-like TrwC/TraI family protein
MLRVTTLYASAAAATAAYYTRYLTEAPGEVPGVWSGSQAAGLGLHGTVSGDALELLLQGRDSLSGSLLGRELVDRYRADGRLVRAVAGFDATFSAPKSVSVWWALTRDDRLLEAHDAAVAGALEHLERFGSTTRVRCDGRRLHPDTQGLTMAVFRQTTSRDDDPQVHTHAVISAKVQTVDGRWLALDARYLKRYQRMLGGLYQSLLRSELTHRFGVGWGELVNGQAEIIGVARDLLKLFSKRSAEIDAALTAKVAEFVDRQGRTPTRFEHAALEREAAKDTRHKKSGAGVSDLATRWQAEAEAVGWTGPMLRTAIETAGREQAHSAVSVVTVREVVESLSSDVSTWGRADVLQAICDRQRPVAEMSAERWLTVLERAADRVVEQCVDLDPTGSTVCRSSDGRSVWIEPTALGLTSEAVLIEEEQIITWAIDAQLDDPNPSPTVDSDGLDVLQADAAAAVAGWDDLVLVVGPAGTGKTLMLARAREDLHRQVAPVFGLAPTAKAARVLERDTGIVSDTVAKLLYEWSRPDLEPDSPYRLPVTTTVIVDEAGMIGTHDLRTLVGLTRDNEWRLVLVGDPQQLQAVGRGGLFAELCRNGRVYHLEHVHRFTHAWEAEASLLLRDGDPQALDSYEAHGRIIPGALDDHLDEIAQQWIDRYEGRETVAVVASTNDHVDLLNAAIQDVRLVAGELDPGTAVPIAGGEVAHVGDVVATRRNERRFLTTDGEPVRNRELWTVTATHPDGSLTVIHNDRRGQVVLRAEYVGEHVRLGYAATEPGYQSDTVTIGVSLADAATTRRGLYVAMTRGREENSIHVITDSSDVAEARDVLERILAVDRSDMPAVTQRRQLAEQDHAVAPTRRREQSGRCEIPDWFNQLRDQTRQELAEAEQRAAANNTERERLQSALAAARAEVEHLEEPSRHDRGRLAKAHEHLEDAVRRHRITEHRLDASGLRGRRGTRRELAAAENQLTWARDRLEQVQASISPDVDRYEQAKHRASQLRNELCSQEALERLDRYTGSDREPLLRKRLDALDDWWRFANGDRIDVIRLGELVDLLGSAADDQGQHRVLAEAVERYCHDAGIRLPTSRPEVAGIEPFGVDVGL